MQNKQLESQIEFLLSAALKKCGNMQDAEDLTQETLLCALTYFSKGGEIKDLRGWLLTVLSNKWNNMLRRKYRQPIVAIGEGFDIIDESVRIPDDEEYNSAEQVRKTVAYMAKTYREVIVRHYMNGESVAEISKSMGIPEGTVKSRLHSGRNRMREEIKTMENYSNQSYHPITLWIVNSGNNGRNNEPGSLVKGDLLAQNLLWAAYEKPVTAEALAKSIGVPTAYVEPILERLADGELMVKTGNKYYTDFIIYTVEDKEKHIPAQKEFVKNNFSLIWQHIENNLCKLKQQDFYKNLNFDQKNSLEMYFAFNCLDYGIYNILTDILGEEQLFPYRKDGGRWIAFATVNFKEFDPMEHLDLMMHSYTGERHTYFEKFTNHMVCQHVYSADGFPNYSYYASPDYDFIKDGEDVDEIITKLLFILHMGIPAEYVGFNEEYLKMIPHLVKCKILREEKGDIFVNIPVINQKEYDILYQILTEAKQGMANDEELKTLFSEFVSDKETKCPSHIDSIPVFKRYMCPLNAMLFACVREAMKNGMLYDGNYDDDSENVNQHPCPMVLVIE
ncbi:MAG: RNA polymerase sigma factor [Clostridia bacterium]|nr:RNA polymerase sigma factor [Clostridia bacterium]